MDYAHSDTGSASNEVESYDSDFDLSDDLTTIKLVEASEATITESIADSAKTPTRSGVLQETDYPVSSEDDHSGEYRYASKLWHTIAFFRVLETMIGNLVSLELAVAHLMCQNHPTILQMQRI